MGAIKAIVERVKTDGISQSHAVIFRGDDPNGDVVRFNNGDVCDKVLQVGETYTLVLYCTGALNATTTITVTRAVGETELMAPLLAKINSVGTAGHGQRTFTV